MDLLRHEVALCLGLDKQNRSDRPHSTDLMVSVASPLQAPHFLLCIAILRSLLGPYSNRELLRFVASNSA